MLRFPLPLAALLLLLTGCSQPASSPLADATGETIVLNRLIVVYRSGVIPANAETAIDLTGARLTARLDRFGMVAISTTAADSAAVQSSLAAQPDVAYVLHDRYVTSHALQISTQTTPTPSLILAPVGDPAPPTLPRPGPFPVRIVTFAPITDSYYDSPQGWAVQRSGGYGDNIPGGISTGPWNLTRGAGVRIAVLDSGVDATHPDIAPNLAFNLSEVDQSAATGLPSPCDDGSPQDQQGHGTWTASLATGALGQGTGLVIGVAPQATLLNIKVLERTPGPSISPDETPTAACESGQPTGLLSWVLQGIDDAVTNHADIISLSLGTLVDLTTGDGAGWKSTFDAATYAAAQSGAVIVAALGNDGLNLDPSGPNARYLELPAQSRSVLPVVASTNPACAEDLTPNATCTPGPIAMPSYSSYGATGAIAAPGGGYPEGPATDPAASPTGFIMGACTSGLPNTTDGLPANGQSFGCFALGHTQYLQATGTSASAALVAGAAAILRAAHPTWTAPQIIAALQSSATTSSTFATPQLNLPAALNLN